MTQKMDRASRSIADDPTRGPPHAKDDTAISPHAPSDPIREFQHAAAVHGGASDANGVPTDAEQHASRDAKRRVRKRKPVVMVAKRDDGHFKLIGASHERLLDTFGTNSDFFMLRQLHEIENMTTRRGEESDPAGSAVNSALALVAGVAPTDEIEAALAVQMAGTHALSCEMAARVMRNDNIDRMNVYLNAATKLQRTFLAQLEALARLRGKGQQTVRVEHVTVEAGAQAIVGDVHHHQPNLKPEDPARVATTRPRRGKALPSPHPIDHALPGTSDEERAMPHARRTKHRRADR